MECCYKHKVPKWLEGTIPINTGDGCQFKRFNVPEHGQHFCIFHTYKNNRNKELLKQFNKNMEDFLYYHFEGENDTVYVNFLCVLALFPIAGRTGGMCAVG
ncbi:MAG TPA: hypothetical protein DCS88_05220 [Alphaproteobacteria bacterium]|nr:hypothetical protein [Alphaproteobacteria bacterium]